MNSRHPVTDNRIHEGEPPARRQDFLKSALRESAETLERLYRRLAQLPEGEDDPEAASWLIENQSYVRAQIREVREALSRGYRRALEKESRGGAPKIYGLVRQAIHDDGNTLGKLTTAALAAFFDPGKLGITLTLAELWAIPPLIKLALIQDLACTAREIGAGDRLSFPPESTERVRGVILRLRSLERIRWRVLIESISPVDRRLARDPAGIYPRMTFETRDAYRKSLERIAHESGADEEEVARTALELAREARAAGADDRAAHVGYYLIGPGMRRLEARGGFSRTLVTRLGAKILAAAGPLYLGAIAVSTAVLALAIARWLGPLPWWWIALLSIPLAQTATALVNLAVNLNVPPRVLPRLDFSKGIPPEHRTLVAVPALLLSRAGVAKLIRQLEIHYLANRDPNLRFALVTDFADSSTCAPSRDERKLLSLCTRGIRRLNRKHGRDSEAPFYLFHRGRQWNASESAWMGWERKRGKLEDLNRLLLGQGDAFETKTGDMNALGPVQYVITLDSDTQLPRDTAWKLAGTMAHPLNRAIADPETGIVREGYAIVQPRAGIDMESAGASRLAGIYSGDTGLDPYATAVSNVYQDLYGRATFLGKGIYDLRAFHASLEGRFPENLLLSHDLIEGEHARTGLATDLDVIEDYPRTYESHCRRKHRWTRGDWQILNWALPWVRRADGVRIANPLPWISRWKILDNLRRSLFEISLFICVLAGAALIRGASGRVLLAALAVLLLPAYVEALFFLLRPPARRFWRNHLRLRAAEFRKAHVEALLGLAFLPHQALLMGDAALRTLARRFVTKRKLLEWESMAQAEAGGGKRLHPAALYLLACPVLGALLALAWSGPVPLALFAAMSLWIGSPLLAQALSAPPSRRRREAPSEVEFLRDLALRTWRYFADFSRPEEHWLVPDNIQDELESTGEGPRRYARTHMTSPTNMGLQSTSLAAAFDLGYLTHLEFSSRVGGLLGTLDGLERHRGHFFNWYDTRTLQTLPPRYVSMVDSGNLAAALLALKQSCAELPRQPLMGANTLEGLSDYCIRLRNALPDSVRGIAVMTRIAALLRVLECRPANLLFWKGTLEDASRTLRELNSHLDWASGYLHKRDPRAAAELRYWQGALNERLRAALDSLCSLAPWLARPFEAELRAGVTNRAFEDLIAAVSRVPSLAGLPDAYDSVESAIDRVLEHPHACSAAFQDLLPRLRSRIEAARGRASGLLKSAAEQARTASRLALEMDFTFLLDRDRDLFRIGYHAESGQLDESYYDLLASEARIAVFLAVAKGDAPREVWFSLGRRIASYRGFRTLLSWSGTMFEYLMPALFMKTFAPTLLSETLTAAVRIQQAYARERGIPWGISESACGSRDSGMRYRYRAFGIPAMSLKRKSRAQAGDPLVVAPYASVLALAVDREAAVRNLREMASRGWTARYGFFESVDFRMGGLSGGEDRPVVVRSFMAHHQGMILAALSNALLGNIMQTRFHSEPLVASAERLLQERVPLAFAPPDEEEWERARPAVPVAAGI